MTLLLALHAVIGVLLFGSGRRLGRRSFVIGLLAPLTTIGWLLTRVPGAIDGRVVHEHVDWVPQLGLGFDLRLDAFAAIMVLLVAGVGIAVLAYSASYFSADDEGLGRTAGLLIMFAGAMLCIVLADDLFVLYTGWELTSITSYLLIGNDHTKARARAAALHALLVTSTGGLAMLAGFVLVGQAAGTYRIGALLDDPPSGAPVTAGLMLIVVGALTKSAQYPFHSWLPGAMAAPTPVSAYLHSATMVKAGVYLVARFAPAFATVGPWRPVVLCVGLTTMVFGGLRALRQHDLKLLLAHGTVSQLGFLVVLFGAGTPAAALAGCSMLVAHAVFKASLFMVVGTLDRMTGTRDIRELPALGVAWWPVITIAAVSAASMAGIPLLFGFVAKESAYEAFAHGGFAGSGVVLAGVVAGSMLTVAYSARFVWGAFVAPRRDVARARPATAAIAPPRSAFVAPMVLLSIVTVVLGLAPGLANGLVGASVDDLHVPGALHAHLAVWHGVNLALVLSAVTLLVGACLFVARRPVGSLLRRGRRIPSGDDVYLALLRNLNRIATRVTGVVQNGSLPIYAGVTLLTAAVVPGVVLVTSAQWPGWPQAIGSGAQLPIVVALLGAAVAAAVVRRRFSAALFLGMTGYAMAGLFVVQGAPDLALTQVAIETLSTVLFVLVLRRLPDRFERTSMPLRRFVRVVISITVAATVFAFAIVARSAREAEPVSTEMVERSLPDGHGRNVVNVILVDMRGFDTLGEITVLTSAAIGAVALARVGARRRPRPGASAT